MQDILGIALYGIPLLLLLVFFVIVDPKGILKAFLNVLAFLAPPIVAGILFGGTCFTAVFINQIWLFPFLLQIRGIFGYCRLRKTGERTEGTVYRQYRGGPNVDFRLPDGTRVSAHVSTLQDYSSDSAVTVLYDAKHPERCCIERHSLFCYIFLSCVWLASGAGILGVTLWVIMSSG